MVNQGLIEIPPVGHISVCYMNGKLCCAPYEEARLEEFTKVASRLPDVNTTKENPRTPVCGGYQDVFRHVDSPLLQRLFHTWFEQGFMAALGYAASPSESNPSWVQTAADWTLFLANCIGSVFGRTFNPKESLTDKVSMVSEIRDWERSNVRAMAWSNVRRRLAVAFHDDSIRIFSYMPTTKDPVLKCRGQQNVACIAWRPLSEQELAVGSSSGVMLWDVEPKGVATRSVRVLQQPGHIPVTSVSWSPTGDLLLSAASGDPSVYVWDPDTERCACLRQVLAQGTGLLSWSPNYLNVLIASTGFAFRIWETKHWQYERWTISSGRVQTACWNAEGNILIFATTEDACIYALAFPRQRMGVKEDRADSQVLAHRILDLTSTELVTGDKVGGLVKSMAWDAKNKFLAIIFTNCDIIMVYQTEISLTVKITPCCVIRGPRRQIPNVMTFMPDFRGGALLTIAWSGGKVQYFPLLGECPDSPESFVRNDCKEVMCIHSSFQSVIL